MQSGKHILVLSVSVDPLGSPAWNELCYLFLVDLSQLGLSLDTWYFFFLAFRNKMLGHPGVSVQAGLPHDSNYQTLISASTSVLSSGHM